MKRALCSAPILRTPDFTKPFLVATDASNVAIGGVLSQLDENNKEYVISYASRSLTKSEINYSVTSREMLAVYWCLGQFRPYIYGKKFTLQTDHTALRSILSAQDMNGQAARWQMALADYEFDVIHRPGVQHGNADAMSRLVFTYSGANKDPIIDAPSDRNVIASHIAVSPSQPIINVALVQHDTECDIQPLRRFNITLKGYDIPPLQIDFPASWIGTLLTPVHTEWKESNTGRKRKPLLFPPPSTQPQKAAQAVITRAQAQQYRARGIDPDDIEEPIPEELTFEPLDSGEDKAIPMELGKFPLMESPEEKQEEPDLSSIYTPIRLIPDDGTKQPLPLSIDNITTEAQRTRLRTYQHEDSFCKSVINELEQRSLVSSTDGLFILVDSILYHWKGTTILSSSHTSPSSVRLITPIPVPERHDDYAIVVPITLRSEVLHTCHNDPLAGHLGIHRTFERIALRFWWLKMATDVHDYVRSCAECASFKPYPLPAHGLTQSLPIPFTPFEFISFDVIGPLPNTKKQNRYVLSIIDFLTRYATLVPLRNTKSTSICTALINEIFLVHGPPRQILTDQAASFHSILAYDLYKQWNINKRRTSAYHPACNGLVERLNKTISAMLAMYVNQHSTDWDIYLPFVAFAYNTTPQSTTKHSPYYLVHGRTAQIPSDFLLPHDPTLTNDPDAYITQSRSYLSQAYAFIRKQLLSIGLDRQYNTESTPSSHRWIPHVNDNVWLFVPRPPPGKFKKFAHLWVGPCMVKAQIGPVTYIIETPLKHMYTTHISRLKRYYPPIELHHRPADIQPEIQRQLIENEANRILLQTLAPSAQQPAIAASVTTEPDVSILSSLINTIIDPSIPVLPLMDTEFVITL